jgi:DNA-binding NarL/FixJ family response regulator
VPISDIAKTSNEVKVSILVVGPDPITKEIIDAFLPLVEVTEIALDIELLLEALEPAPSIILCTVPAKVSDASEMGQLLSSQYGGVPVYLVTHKDTKLNRKVLLKNGYTDIYLMPLDKDLLKNVLDESISKIRKAGKVFKAVKLFDLAPDTNLEFDTFIHMSANNKYIRYSAAGDPIDKERTDKLKQHDVGSLHIAAKDTKKFYDYTALRLKDLQGDAKLSETEKAEKMKSSVRELFGSKA